MDHSGHTRITKLDYEGHVVLTYPGQLVYVDENCAIARCSWGARAAHDLGPFGISPGDIMVETFFADEWFNIFAIYCGTGLFKGWYCNITMPANIRDCEILWYDLALDLVVLPHGQLIELDRDEFDTLPIDVATRTQADKAMRKLYDWAKNANGPFCSLTYVP